MTDAHGQFEVATELAEAEARELRQRQRAYIRLSREIYNDAGAARPPFTGEADAYRRRQYHVDRTKSSWSVEVPSS